MFNRAVIKRLEDENAYLRKLVDNLLGRLGIDKVVPDVEPAPDKADQEDGAKETIQYGGE